MVFLSGMKKLCSLNLLFILYHVTSAQSYKLPEQNDRWKIQPDGSIVWTIDERLPHHDHIEMSGEQVSLWLQYGVDTSGRPVMNRTMVFPTFRLLPQRTTAHMMYDVKDEELPRFILNDRLLKTGVFNASVQEDQVEKVMRIRHNGITQLYSSIGREGTVKLTRTVFPSVDKPMVIERWVFYNEGKQPVRIEMEEMNRRSSPAASRTVRGPHHFLVQTSGHGVKNLSPNDSVSFVISYQAIRGDASPLLADAQLEERKRSERVSGLRSLLRLETPDPVLNTMFDFAKIRGTESIYKTRSGYMHGPGGLRYYAAIWANDQAEYINPFFAFLGDDIGNQSAMNAFRIFARYMNKDFKPIPSSIIAEGDGVWHGRGDRGDMAMIAYGAARYALAYGHADSARVLWPLIEWCLDYLQGKVNKDGVVWSNSDELEGRFPSGDANLNTSSLYYDALLSAVMLGRELNLPKEKLNRYAAQAKELRANIEKYFGRTVEGFQTYRYYAGNDTLRAWITTPLTVDIYDRREGTIAALFSPRLWTEDGLASLAGNKTFWDRSTLYGLRGVFAAGETEKALPFLQYYSRRRLLGEHVPYAVEAYPEGNQRHLSAESGLYARIFTEGIFGMRPTGFTRFNLTPRLPKAWNQMALRNIHAFGNRFDVEVKREGNNRLVVLIQSGLGKKIYRLKEGETVEVRLGR